MIRFTCSACRTTMKLGDPITESKKVRCSGCNTVIVVSPHPANPSEVITSIPDRRKRSRPMSEGMRRNILIAIAVLLVLFVVGAVWYTQKGEAATAAAEGEVTLDDAPMAKGFIVFSPTDTSKGAREVKVPIQRGTYSVGAWSGPYIGANKVQIFGSDTEPVAARWNVESAEPPIGIHPGVNKKNYAVTSK